MLIYKNLYFLKLIMVKVTPMFIIKKNKVKVLPELAELIGIWG